jgi:hypothetical protein
MIVQLASHGTVDVTAPETATDAPLTPPPELVEVTFTAMAIGRGQGL